MFLTGGFYIVWLECLANLSDIEEKNSFASEMKKEFLRRSPSVMNNMALTAALCMDNRFNFPGSTIVPVETHGDVQVSLFLLIFFFSFD